MSLGKPYFTLINNHAAHLALIPPPRYDNYKSHWLKEYLQKIVQAGGHTLSSLTDDIINRFKKGDTSIGVGPAPYNFWELIYMNINRVWRDKKLFYNPKLWVQKSEEGIVELILDKTRASVEKEISDEFRDKLPDGKSIYDYGVGKPDKDKILEMLTNAVKSKLDRDLNTADKVKNAIEVARKENPAGWFSGTGRGTGTGPGIGRSALSTTNAVAMSSLW